jgi:hypothetical protein
MINNKVLDKDVIRVKSTIDDQVYVVRDLPNSQEAANLLAKLKKDILKFVDHMRKSNSEDPGVKRMLNNLKINWNVFKKLFYFRV